MILEFQIIIIQNENVDLMPDDTTSNKRQEVEYDVKFEKIISCKEALGKLICDNEWRSKLRKTVSIMTQIRFFSPLRHSISFLFRASSFSFGHLNFSIFN